MGSTGMYTHANQCMNTWTDYLHSCGKTRWRVYHISHSSMVTICSAHLPKLSLWVNYRSTWGWNSWQAHRGIKAYRGQQNRRWKSVTLFHALNSLLIGWWNLLDTPWKALTRGKRNHASQTFIQSQALSGLGWDVTNGDEWSSGLTYFSFWEGLLWPASALNCALDPVSKRKPKWKKKMRDSRKSEARQKTEQQTNQKTQIYALSVEDGKAVKNFKFLSMFSTIAQGR